MPRPVFKPYRYSCAHNNCDFRATSQGGLKRHVLAKHRIREYLNQSPPRTFEVAEESEVEDVYELTNRDHQPGRDHTPEARSEEGPARSYKVYHRELNAAPCREDGVPLGPNSPPPPWTSDAGWYPFRSRAEFELADFVYKKEQLSATGTQQLLDIIGALLVPHGDTPPFASSVDLHATIDAIKVGDVPWQSFSTHYTGVFPEGVPPSWMTADYEVHFRDPHAVVQQMLSNPSFASDFDPVPHRDFDDKEERVYSDFMSGNWAWRQADQLAKEPGNHGAMVVPIILGSDKTTVSVATGQNDFYPLYMSLGNISNALRRSHRGAVALIGFLATPKCERKHDKSAAFASFRRQLFHRSLAFILHSLKPGASDPQILRCPDGHFRRGIYCLGPYIADYPEQALLTGIVQGWCPKCLAHKKDLDGGDPPCRSRGLDNVLVELFSTETLYKEFGIHGDTVPFTNDFPHADIHEMISPDLLHQVIKGTFKDHLVTWVGEYVKRVNGGSDSAMHAVLDEIDRRIAATPSFPGLRHFHDGRRFKQWTGDDSKALMKVYIPAIVGLVPDAVVQSFAAFLDFCYLVRRSVITQDTLRQIDSALRRFHQHRTVFVTAGVRTDFTLPRQHSLKHYHALIEEYGAPNGLCTSITESKHIKAVKEPWRRSNRFNALRQMLLTNQRLDKLDAARADFTERGMLRGDVLSAAWAAYLQSLSPNHSPAREPSARTTLTGIQHDHESHIPTSSQAAVSVPDRAGLPTNSESTNDGDVEIIEGPRVVGTVDLARTPQRAPYPHSLQALGHHVACPNFVELIHRFLADQNVSSGNATIDHHPLLCPELDPHTRVSTYHSARAVFYGPSDPCGVGGMRAEYLRSTPSWRGEGERRDCAFAVKDHSLPGMLGLQVVRIKLLFSFKHENQNYPCALVEWFSLTDTAPDDVTGFWVVEPDVLEDGSRELSVIHIDSILRAAHLIPVYGAQYLPPHFHFSHSLNCFGAYYVNHYADHHAHELLHVPST